MTNLPQLQADRRAPRLRLAEDTPAVVRAQDGRRFPGKLEVVSVTGGLLSLQKPLAQGSRVRVMFVIPTGSVFGGAEMLNPVSQTKQPFRFVTLYEDDHSRLQSAVQGSMQESRRSYSLIEKTRPW